jgi:creatinine amidohydrolase
VPYPDNRMRWLRVITFVCLVTGFAVLANSSVRGVLLEGLSWQEAERVLTPESVVVIALGAESKEHGPHLQLNNDWVMAEYFKRRVLDKANIVVAPTINYSFYPAFREYPGSTSLRLETARDMIVDIVLSLSRFGPRRFYILNTGISTVRPLKLAQEELAKSGVEMRFTDLSRFEDLEKKVRQSGGTHADEIETSMMLYIAPQSVNMKIAIKDLNENKPGGLTRDPNKPGTYSPTGTWGDPTKATKAKGKVMVEGMIERILQEIEELRQARLPEKN